MAIDCALIPEKLPRELWNEAGRFFDRIDSWETETIQRWIEQPSMSDNDFGILTDDLAIATEEAQLDGSPIAKVGRIFSAPSGCREPSYEILQEAYDATEALKARYLGRATADRFPRLNAGEASVETSASKSEVCKPRLSPAILEAYKQFKYARRRSKQRLRPKEAYRYLKGLDLSDDERQKIHPRIKRDTWIKYVQRARKKLGLTRDRRRDVVLPGSIVPEKLA